MKNKLQVQVSSCITFTIKKAVINQINKNYLSCDIVMSIPF